MSRAGARAAFVAVLLAAVFSAAGCIFDTEEMERPEESSVVFEDLTEKEHVIINLVNSYRTLDDTQYLRLLLSAEDEKPTEYGGGAYASAYYWYNQQQDVIYHGLDEYLDLQTDYDRTRNIFDAAKETPIDPDKHQILDKLTLQIFDGTWTPADSLFGDECDDCWKTLREYDIWLWIQGEDLQMHAFDNVEFYIVPVQDGDKKTYRIAAAYDILAD